MRTKGSRNRTKEQILEARIVKLEKELNDLKEDFKWKIRYLVSEQSKASERIQKKLE